MQKLFIPTILAVLCLLSACTMSESSSNTSKYSEIEQEALEAAQRFVRVEYASDAVFQNEGTIIEEADVPKRFKVLQRFESQERDGYNFVYRIWVQEFPTGWEFGNLAIEDAGGKSVLTRNGRMKHLEREYMYAQEKDSIDGIEYTIIKRNAPEYVRLYTAKRLSRDQVLSVYSHFKGKYNSIQFSTSLDPKDDDYMSIMYGTVYEYDTDKITKLEDY